MSDILAKALSIADADEQAALLNRMARELFVMCGGKSKMEIQLCFLSDKLNADGKAMIRALADFVRLRDEKIE